MRFTIKAALLALGLVAGGASQSRAAFTALNFTTPTVDFTNGAWSLGFAFTANTTFNVTSLGFYDDLGNGLTESHDVGIYTDTGTLLASATVTPGDTLAGLFRYTSIAPLTLTAGNTYVIAATTGSENYTWDPADLTVDPNITFLNDLYTSSTTLVFPMDSTGGGLQGWFGPNFIADQAPTAVPAPAGVLLGLLGLPALGVAGRLRRRAAV